MERGWHKPFGLIAAALLLLAALEFAGPGLLRHLEYGFNDLLLKQQAEQRRPDGEIVLLDIDEASLARMAPEQGRYPWARSVHAEVVEWIARQQPRAIVFDIIFSDPDPLRPDDDAYLAEVAAAHDNLFFPFVKLQTDQPGTGLPLEEYGKTLGFERTANAGTDSRAALLLPYMALAVDGRLGVINFQEQSDGVGRHYPLYLHADGWRLPSLPAKVAAAHGSPLPEQAAIRLNWQGPANSYPRVAYVDVYEDLLHREPQRPTDEFHDKIVIIGSTATGQHDLRTTPVGSLQPALEIVATAIDNLRKGNYLRDAPGWLPPLVTLLLIGSLWFAFRLGVGAVRIGALLLLVTPLLFATAYLALGAGWWLPLFTPVLFGWGYYALAALYAYRQAQMEKQRSVQIFSRFLDPRVVNDLVSHGESALNIKPESRRITVLFSDIRGFTTLSERHSAEEIVALLNDYFSRQVQVIFQHQGTMDKFIGDAIMAFWGAPVADDNQACHAVAAALDMADALQQFKHDLGAADENFDVGIGIHTGPGVVGFIGSDNRLDYTAIGDTVNLASRIEGQTKGVARILVSADTREQCGDAFDFIDHGFYKVKGRTQEVRAIRTEEKEPMMRRLLTLLAALLFSLPLQAQEQTATVLRDSPLRAEPFSDAASLGKLKAKSRITVLQRSGGWYQVRDARDRNGWLRMSSVRMGDGLSAADNGNSGIGQTLRFLSTGRSGASGTTVATGIRGLDAADVANANPDHEAVKQLAGYQVSDGEARSAALSAGLQSRKIKYLKEPK